MTKLEDVEEEDIQIVFLLETVTVRCPKCGKKHKRFAYAELIGQKKGQGVYEILWMCPTKDCFHSYVGYCYNLLPLRGVQAFGKQKPRGLVDGKNIPDYIKSHISKGWTKEQAEIAKGPSKPSKPREKKITEKKAGGIFY